MLEVLGYQPSQSDERKFLHHNYRQPEARGQALEASWSPSKVSKHVDPVLEQAEAGPSDDLSKYLNSISDKVFEIGEGPLPRLQNTVLLLKNEVQSRI